MKILLTNLLFFISLSLFCQTPEQSLWWNNTSVFNPAFTASDYNHNATFTFRGVEPRIKNTPRNLSSQYEILLCKNKKLKTGLGVNYLFDDLSSIKTQNLRLNIAEHINFSENHQFSIGLGLGAEINKYSSLWFTLDPDDPAIPQSFSTNEKFQWNAGIRYKLKKLTVAAGAANLNEKPPTESDFFSQTATYSFQGGYEIKISDKVRLTPRLNILSHDGFTLSQANAALEFKEKFTFGVSLSDNKKAGFNLGYILRDKLHFNYAYLDSYSRLNVYIDSAHEVSVSFRIKSS